MFRKGIVLLMVMALLLSGFTSGNADEIGYVNATGLYIRTAPNTSAEALRCAANGEALTILKSDGDWYYVKYNDVVSGYVAKKYVTKTKPATGVSSASGASSSASLPSKVTDLGKSPASTRLGDRGSDVKKLQEALKILGYYAGNADGIYGEQTEMAVKNFQKSRGLTQDGVAGQVTLNILFGGSGSQTASASGGAPGATTLAGTTSATGVEILDWDNGGNGLIPKGATFTIKDVRSGTKITVKHLFGANHLDAEPLNATETAKLKQVYGGEWSWARRPVLISYGGRVVAASMNGMPHGEQSILDNDFEGQFCIHFLNSKTHGSSKVDGDHQTTIMEAAKASW